MRLFIALDLPDSAKQMLITLQQKLLATGMKGRAVPTQNLHVTLHFLGEVDDRRSDEVCAAVEQALRAQLAPQVFISGVGAFMRAAGDTVFAQLDGDIKALAALEQKVVGALFPLGIRADNQPFTPHVTLIRNADFGNRGLRAKSEVFLMSTVSVYASKLAHGMAPEYTKLCEVMLAR